MPNSKLIDLTLLQQYNAGIKQEIYTPLVNEVAARTALIDAAENKTQLKGDVIVGSGAAPKDLSITGDLYVSGTQHIVDTQTIESQSNLIVANSNNSVLSSLGGAGVIARVGNAQSPDEAYAIGYYDVATSSVQVGVGSYSKIEYAVSNNKFTADNVEYTISVVDGSGTVTGGGSTISVVDNIFTLDSHKFEIYYTNSIITSVMSQEFLLTGGQPIATRTDSTQWTNARIPQWDSANNRFIDSGKVVSDFVAKNAPITGATKTKITYDSKGLVTAGGDLAESDIPTLSISKISGLQDILNQHNNIENGTGEFSLVQQTASGEENTATYEGAIALGKSNQALNTRAFVGGSTNIGAGHTSFTFGQLITNRGGVSTAFGKEHIIAPDPDISGNDTLPQENFVVGKHNVVYASPNNGVGNFMVGLNNVAKGSYGTVFGSDNYIPANKYISLSNADYVGAFIVGAFADANKNNLLFAIGNGDYNTSSQTEQRQNALEVYYNGQVKAKSAPVDDDDVLRFGDIDLTKGLGSYSIKQKSEISYPNTVTSNYSIGLGRKNTITGSAFSLTLGSDNTINITDSGNYNTVIGTDNEITGEAGRVTLIGEGLRNTSWWQTVVGRYNKVDTYSSSDERPLFLVGNGYTGYRSNAFSVIRDGRAKVQSAPVENNDVVRKLELDTAFANLNVKNGEGVDSIKLEGNTVLSKNGVGLGQNNIIQADRAFGNGGGNVIRYDPNNPNSINGYMGFASGQNNYISGWAAATIGEQLEAKNGGQTIVGKANLNKNNTIFEAGNGTIAFINVDTKPTWAEVLDNPIYYKSTSASSYTKITNHTMTETQYNALTASDIYVFDDSGRSNAFEILENGVARSYANKSDIGNNKDLITKEYADENYGGIVCPTIAITLAQISGTGNDSYTSAQYIRFAPTQEQSAILANNDYAIIKLDLTGLGNAAPAPYIWLRRNTVIALPDPLDQSSTIPAYQFTCGGEQFWYDNYATDIAIKNIGNAALVYVPALGSADITLLSISVPDLYIELGKIPDKVDKTIEIAGIQISTGISASDLMNSLFDVELV